MCMLIVKYSSSAHELLLHLLVGTHGAVGPVDPRWGPRSVLQQVLADVVLERRAVEPSLDPKGPRERSAAQCQLETLGGGVQMRPSTGCSPRRIRDEPVPGALVACDDA